MSLLTVAAQIMSLAQDGHANDAARLAAQTLPAAGTESIWDQAALWYTISVMHHIQGDVDAQHGAAQECLSLARSIGASGWAANALSVRAMAQIGRGAVEAALLDLARSEVELAASTDAGLRNWAHTGLANGYVELRLYELAEPHLLSAVESSASPLPLEEGSVIDYLNLADLHLRWAEEIERVMPIEDDSHPTPARPDQHQDPHEDELGSVERHRSMAHSYAKRALSLAEHTPDSPLAWSARALAMRSGPTGDAASLTDLREALTSPQHRDHLGGRAQIGNALARTLWAHGDPEEAIVVARQAAADAARASNWQISASAQWLLVELKAQSGVPGAAVGRAYGHVLSQVLWRQRLSTLQGARAALDVERLKHDKDVAVRAAAQDPLTGIANRRVLDAALREAAQETAREAATATPVTPRHRYSLLLVDLDDFKTINDSYGHLTGDRVLRAVAQALRSVARPDDVVARLGGDEFVLLARDADPGAGQHLVARLSAAIDRIDLSAGDPPLTLSASIGVATTSDDVGVEDLLAKADAQMYRAKAQRGPQSRGA